MNLSILVCTIESRKKLLARLLERLQPQIIRANENSPQSVELLIDSDNGEITIGAKRQLLLGCSSGLYVCFIDDDDMVAEDYCESILRAIELGPDCVGFLVRRMNAGSESGPAEFRCPAIHSIRNERYSISGSGPDKLLLRTANHLTPVRRELALMAGFEPLNAQEDNGYAERLYPLIKSEVFIERFLYDYLERSQFDKRNEVTNAKRIA